ncbi:MAG: hypothetical protein JWP63_1253 [Candidatus Solibacter sp.]|nr:hypothetical protein [Candidatus Solibacter sp.]
MNVERSVVQRDGRQKSDGDRHRKTCRKESCPRKCKFEPDDLEVNEKHRCGGYQQNPASPYTDRGEAIPAWIVHRRREIWDYGRAGMEGLPMEINERGHDEAAEEDSAAHRQEYAANQAGCKPRHGTFASLRDHGFGRRTRGHTEFTRRLQALPALRRRFESSARRRLLSRSIGPGTVDGGRVF